MAQKIEERMHADRSKNMDGAAVSYFEFSDLTKVKTEHIRLDNSCNQWDDHTGSLVDFRNWVMHSARADLTADYSMRQLVNYDDRLFDLSERVHQRLGSNAREVPA